MQPSSTTRQRGAGAAAVRRLLAVSVLAAPCALAQNINTTSGLTFGRFAANSGGAVSVSTAAVRTRTGSVVLLSSTITAATFRVPIRKNQTIIVTLPANGSTALTSGSNSMALTNFVSSIPSGNVGGNERNVSVGATLQVGAQQAQGNYTGTINIIVEYQ